MSANRLTCHSVAVPLRAFIDGGRRSEGTILGSSPTAAYFGFDDVVVALTARTVPLMPNAAALIESDGLDAFEAGAVVRTSSRGVCAGRVEVIWDEAVSVDLAVLPNEGRDARAVARRGSDLLEALGHGADPLAAVAAACPELAAGGGLEAVRLLLAALTDGETDVAREAASLLTGRGPGLTPDGDDLLAAAAAATIAFGGPAGLNRGVSEKLRAALLVDELQDRTGALSATLLRLAAEGQVIDPVRTLLDLGVGRAAWMRALSLLGRIGHSTGGTYALGCALTALALAGKCNSGHVNQIREEKP